MFGPNVIPGYSHRDKVFSELLTDTSNKFMRLANLNVDRDIVLYITGSGTLANEIVIKSLKNGIDVRTQGEFSTRLSKCNISTAEHTFPTFVQYETAVSENCSLGIPYNSFTDAISAFPYYNPPPSRVWTSVSSKQFGGMTGLSLIILRDYRQTIHLFKDEELSYLSLRKYFNKQTLKNQTPNTPAMDAIKSFNEKLSSFNIERFRQMIDNRRDLVSRAETNIGTGPVVTYKHMNEEIIDKYKIYTNGGRPQIFLWSGSDEQYENFIKDNK